MGRARRNDSSCWNLGWTASYPRLDGNCGLSRTMWQLRLLPSRDDIFICSFIFTSKNGSREMGAKVDPTVSSGCCSAPSQTRLISMLLETLPLSLGRWNNLQLHRGEITGTGVKETTELPLWPENCETPSPLNFARISPRWRRLSRELFCR